QTLGQLAVSACTKALDDAGLRPSDVDGISNYPAAGGPLSSPAIDGVHIVGVEYLSQAMRLENLVCSCSITGGTFTASLVEAALALAAGACDTVLVWRAMHNPVGAF